MEHPVHPFTELFEQLGLPADEASIRAFIERHSPLPPTLALHEAPFWNQAQAAFLHAALEEDADWAEVVDHLDASLRKT
ncbi:DUF2789 domain-containing protein [Billgrantia desiderata]|uniref:DUF2789 domain-containing protein n=1 Tax=Billgrantia desiderata TaxID=52021 RepID=A0AAW4YQX7_9GAMM|nr:DUF2789 domain-containing protein [Halomonas desiderata]MCE8010831.1 DUF2789 domain-containing protein [Halomonas desiderata]MCE8027448.1 DUF2789 domain-containing protein [Halomonas desiderata]MCE8041120.1 DUF2789 domain-containing protein [Halomonas desiderata]MCE8045695.1 DUF2789 domain-containing protein [Halomonas desiderata]MCE8051097.1 DUF2789 domain-containing protein [Halomonas desiderata]